MNTSKWVTSAVTAVAVLFSAQALAVAGKFQFVNGEVQVLDASGKARAVKKGDAIDQGETVSSGSNGFAQIRMEDGGFFAVRPETEFKIDTFKYEGKEDGSEKGIFSLVKGSLRAVTGAVGNKHKDNYKINTAIAAIGIRGSGADAGHSSSLGTAVRTLFGAHSLTSGGKTIYTAPGQTAMTPPGGGAPQYVYNFPFNTSTTSNQGGGDSGGGTGGSGNSNNNGANNGSSGNSNNSGNEDNGNTPQNSANNNPDNNSGNPANNDTATAAIGIRGSGADAGHSSSLGTAVRTLFGAHSLTSGGKTINTGPGQTALASPDGTLKFVSGFPFNTSTTGGGNNNNSGNEDNGNTPQNSANNNPDNNSGNPANNDKVVIPIVNGDGTLNLTDQTNNGAAIGDGFAFAGTGQLPSGNYLHFISALNNIGGIFVAEQESDEGYFPPGNYTFNALGALVGARSRPSARMKPGNYTFNALGALVGVADSELFITYADQNLQLGSSSFTVVGGTFEEEYHTPDNSIFIARGSNLQVNTVCSSCSGTDTFINVYSIVALANAPAFVQTLTGTTNYTLTGGLKPTDAQGNVGTLNSAYINANFTNMTVGFGLNLSIAGKTIDAYASGAAIVQDFFDADSGNGLNVNCTGASCVAGGYYGDVGGGFFGNAAGSAALVYDFWPNSDNSLPGPYAYYTEYNIHGIAALVAGSAPTAVPSTAGVVGGGWAAVGSFSSTHGFNDFRENVVDNLSFAARHDSSGNLIAWTDNNVPSPVNEISFAARGTVVQDGSDSTLGVIWGRWSAFSATAELNAGGGGVNLTNQGGLSFITGSHITTTSELGALSMTASYSMATAGVSSIPTMINGVASGVINSASATVNFGTGMITTFSVAGSGGGYGAWNATGSGSIAGFAGSTGIGLSGSCSTGSGSCAISNTLSGKAVGGFVGSSAQGMISTVGLQTTGGDKLGGAVYMKR